MDYIKALPEIFLLTATCVLLLVDAFTKQKRLTLTYILAQLILIITAVLSLKQFNTGISLGFNGNFIRDNFSTLLEILICIATFITFVASRGYILVRGNLARGEYYILALFATLGMLVLVSAHTLLSLYLGLELMSLPLYAMVAMQRENEKAIEAAMKYFVMGAIASGMMLYGIALLFGSLGTIDIDQLAQGIQHGANLAMPVVVLAIALVVVGIAFKFGAAPFHMWVPDVYQGAPTSVTLLLGTGPKLAALGMAYRLLVEVFPAVNVQWQPLLILVAIVSMALGNLLAIAQSNIKRMLAYSSIGHMGYMLLGFVAATAAGYSAALFYMISYVTMTIAAFALLIILSRQGFECEKINDLQGLNTRSPWLAFLMLLTMFSMAGLPPLVGFFAKITIFEALINSHLVWLTVVAIIFSIIGLYYYLRVVKVMYFDRPVSAEVIEWDGSLRVVTSVTALALLGFGVFPGGLINLCHQVLGAL